MGREGAGVYVLRAMGLEAPPATAASRMVSTRQATPWQHGTGRPVRGACMPRVRQRWAGCAGLRVLLRLGEVRQRGNTRSLF